jgi:hypothetical protein
MHWIRWARGMALRTMVLELLVALSLACLAWIYTRSREELSLDQVEVPVKLMLAPGLEGKYDLQVNRSNRILMSFTGPPSRMRELRSQLHHGQLQVVLQVSVPEEHKNENAYHDIIRIEPENVPAPPGVATLIVEGHNTISYTAHRLAERLLPVQLDYTGDMRLSDVQIEPATVMVRGPKEILDRARAIATQPYTLPAAPDAGKGGSSLIQGQASLVRELEGRTVQTTPPNISFRFKAHPLKRVYDLRDVPVRFLCPPHFSWTPRFADTHGGKITLRVRGPATDEPPPVLAFIDLTGVDLGAGRNVLPLRIHLPGDFQLVNDAPRLIAFYLDPAEHLQHTTGQ